ncbi:O-antigen ligase family protein [Pseudonocardia lacus]|uniref:O-antigen ligase family protein n=1 Tax=Pseudonocardia lacus TaxID=2835865 RepID=UPI001BDBCA62|nr:O-antigen ligase family protein [Pseudonocardia lacus]
MVVRARPLQTFPAARLPAPGHRLLLAYGWVIGPLLAGYLFLDRAFAYLHVPGTPLYVGELVLVLGVVAVLASTGYLRVPLRDESILALLALFVLWGLARSLPGLGEYGIDTIRDSAVWYYAVFAFLIVAALARAPELLDRLLDGLARLTPWLLLWLPAAVLLVPFAASAPEVPFSDVSVLSHKSGNAAAAALLVLAGMWLSPRRVRARTAWSLLALLVIALVATQNRGGLLGAAAGAMVWLAFHRDRLRIVAKAAALITIGVTLISLLEVSVPVGGLQGRAFSTAQLVDNVRSIFGSEVEGNLLGTVGGREELWTRVIERQVAEDQLLTGAGFGPNLASEVGILDAGTDALRTPHNSHLNILARMGVLGFALWVAVWVGWYWRMVHGVRRLQRLGLGRRRQAAGLSLSFATAVLVSTFFDPQLEGAQVAALLWTMFGVGVAVTSRSPRFDGALRSGAPEVPRSGGT